MAKEHVAVIEALFDRADCAVAVRKWRQLALSVAHYVAALQVLHAPGVSARRLLLRSFALAPIWPRYFRPERRRSWLLVLYILAAPMRQRIFRWYMRIRCSGLSQ
jgi:hypothetical protein